ncbi:MAG: anaerobic ribonucleoside-triphosphate reductase [Patescibacteria group bacterium]|nr:anaerobic ribonucleoside-triphosphate reductase [Patescibacteria group bacterium]
MNDTKDETLQKDLESKRQKCEVFSRVVGYLRPVDAWNPGKQEEFKDREEFVLG